MASLAGSRGLARGIKREFAKSGLEPTENPAIGIRRTGRGNVSFEPDGRACRLCDCKDSDGDRVVVSEYMAWGAAIKDGKNQGKVDEQCLSLHLLLWNRRHAHNSVSIHI
jgi:hypothetical protein